MSDERTLRLAFRPVSEDLLDRYVRVIELELAGKPSADALKAVEIAADDVTRIASAVNAFCRPRLLKRRLARAVAKSPTRQQKQQEELGRPVDDSELIGLHGPQTHQTLLAREAVLVDLRERLAK